MKRVLIIILRILVIAVILFFGWLALGSPLSLAIISISFISGFFNRR